MDHKVFSEAKALEYSYCIHNCREAVSEYLPLQRMQSADRYGGYGVGYCGGSARCGTYGDVQVKGIGLTPLIGSSPGAPLDPWHSSGTVTLNEAGREALWSGICDAVLPFGAVATTAVVLTGTKCLRTDGAPGVEILNRRALIMREVALRPAHFLRNVHFQTPLVPGAPACEDYFRVRQMVRSLPINFDQAFGAEIEGSSATARVSSGMKIMANRFAAQVAAAFAKRLYHGSLNCTNIALDGRYVDFGTMTAVNAYRRQAGSPLWPDQWSQHTPLLRTLTYLLFHVRKHLDCPEIKNLIAPDELTAEFSAALHQRTQIELLKQTGIPEQTIATYPEAKRSRAYRCLKDVYSRGAHTSFVWRGDDDPSMVGVQPLQSLGRYDLNEILTKAAQCSDESALRSVIDTLLGDACLAREFCEVYADIVEWFLESHSGMNPAVLRAFLARQAMRLNADVSHLTREALDTAMAEFEENPSGLGAYIDGTIRNAREIMDDEPPEMLDAHGRAICGLTGQLEALGQMRPDQAFAMLGYGSQGNVHADTAKAHGQAICATA
ncbi:MAG: hypothetical protein WCG35_10795 [Betaproteobacteria bacterium]